MCNSLSISIVKVFSPKGKLLQMWPVDQSTEFLGTIPDYKKFVRENKCSQILKRHPRIKPEDLEIELNVKEIRN